jgi:hypothetical protein
MEAPLGAGPRLHRHPYPEVFVVGPANVPHGFTNTGVPPLQDEDAVFQPLRPEEGRWYGGGRAYTLAELVDHRALPYRYDALFTV